MNKAIKNSNIYGVFGSEEKLLSAVRNIKESGFSVKNVYTPYPVHEIFHELGLKTRFPYFAFVFGAGGTLLTFAFLYWTSVIDFPITVGGKPSLSMSFVIILFVMTINIGIVLSLLAFFSIQKLYPGKKADILHADVTDDKYVIVIEKRKNMPESEISALAALLKNNGALETGFKDNVENI